MSKYYDEFRFPLPFDFNWIREINLEKQSFPFYNTGKVIIKNSEREADVVGHFIELALAGYKADWIDVYIEDLHGVNYLIVETNEKFEAEYKESKKQNGSGDYYDHLGIKKSEFRCSFELGKNTEAEKVIYCDGILRIDLKVNKIQQKSPKMLKIENKS